jgi:hypothetical protein
MRFLWRAIHPAKQPWARAGFLFRQVPESALSSQQEGVEAVPLVWQNFYYKRGPVLLSSLCRQGTGESQRQTG